MFLKNLIQIVIKIVDLNTDGWLFQNTDYVLKEQQEYFDDLSQHIGRYIRALIDNPHSGSKVKKGDVGKIFSSNKVAFPNSKNYSCSNALSEGTLGVKYELFARRLFSRTRN